MAKQSKEEKWSFKLEQALKEKEQIDKEYSAVMEKYRENNKKRQDLFLKSKKMDLVNKFIMYDNGSDEPEFLLVKDIIRRTWTSDENMEYNFILRGVGFKYLFTEYEDMTFCGWSEWHEICINAYNEEDLETKLSFMKEITKEEYMQYFDEMLRDLEKRHMENMIDYEHTK